MLGWNFNQDYKFLDNSGNYNFSTEADTTQPAGIMPGTMNVYGMIYDGVGETRTAFVNGAVLSTQASSVPSLRFDYRSNVNLGYFRYANLPVNFDMAGYIIIPKALTVTQAIQVMQMMMGDLGIRSPLAVIGLTVGAATTSSQALSWTIPSGQLAGTTYSISYRVDGTSAWNSGVSGLKGTSGTLQTLNSNTNYDYQIVSNYNGYTTASAIVMGKTPAAAAGNGRTIPHLGVDISGLENSSPTVTNDSSIKYFGQGVGIKTYRVAYAWYHLQPTLGQTTLDPTALAQMKQVVQSCLNYGATRIFLDNHDYCTYNGVAYGTGASGSPTIAQFAAFKVLLFSDPMFKNNPIFVDGAANEPHINAAAWYPFVQASTNAFRSAGITNLIAVAPASGGGLGSIGEQLGNPPQYTDTLQTIEECHQYWDSTNAGLTAVVNAYDFPISMAGAFSQMRSSGSNTKLFLGEVGFDNGSAAQAALAACLSIWQRNGDILDSVGLWGGGAFSNNYIYGINNGNAPGTMAQLASYLPGGSNYGTATLAATAGLFVASGNAPVFGGTNKFGNQTLQSGFLCNGGKYSSNRNLIAATMECRFSYKATSASSYITGDLAWMSIQTTATGAIQFTYGNGSRVTFTTPLTYNDGVERHFQVCAGPNGGTFYVDGKLVGSSTTSYSASGPSSNVATGIGCWYKKTYTPVPGQTSEVIWWGIAKNTAAFTPRTQSLSALVAGTVGITDGLLMFADLNGNTNTYC